MRQSTSATDPYADSRNVPWPRRPALDWWAVDAYSLTAGRGLRLGLDQIYELDPPRAPQLTPAFCPVGAIALAQRLAGADARVKGSCGGELLIGRKRPVRRHRLGAVARGAERLQVGKVVDIARVVRVDVIDLCRWLAAGDAAPAVPGQHVIPDRGAQATGLRVVATAEYGRSPNLHRLANIGLLDPPVSRHRADVPNRARRLDAERGAEEPGSIMDGAVAVDAGEGRERRRRAGRALRPSPRALEQSLRRAPHCCRRTLRRQHLNCSSREQARARPAGLVAGKRDAQKFLHGLQQRHGTRCRGYPPCLETQAASSMNSVYRYASEVTNAWARPVPPSPRAARSPRRSAAR